MDGIRKFFSRYLLVFVTGAVIGALSGVAGSSVLISYRIDRYHQQIQYLQNIINERELKLSKLEESINKNRFLLKSIEITIDNEEDELDRIELEKAVRAKYGSLIGKEVKSIDVGLVAEVVDSRRMTVNNREYKLTVSRVLISEVLKIWIDAKLLE